MISFLSNISNRLTYLNNQVPLLVFDGRPRKKRNLGAGTGGMSGEAPQYGKILF